MQDPSNLKYYTIHFSRGPSAREGISEIWNLKIVFAHIRLCNSQKDNNAIAGFGGQDNI